MSFTTDVLMTSFKNYIRFPYYASLVAEAMLFDQKISSSWPPIQNN
jgi:hypothetical protein